MEQLICSITLFIITFIIYIPTLFFDRVIDDTRRARQFATMPEWRLRWHTVPSIIDSVKRFFYAGGIIQNTRIDHAVTLTMYSTVPPMIYLLFGSNMVSLFAALLYAVHPVNTQVSIWLNGRRYLTALVLCLLSLLVKPIGFLLFPLAIANHIIALPTLIYYKNPYVILVLLALSIPSALYLKTWFTNRKNQFNKDTWTGLRWVNFIPMVKTFGYYFTRCLFPQGIHFYGEFMQDYHYTNSGNRKALKLNYDFFKGLVILSICSITIGVTWGTPLAQGLLWWMVYTAVISNWIYILMVTADRYQSIANVGLMLALAHILVTLGYTASIIGLTAFLTYYLTILYRDMGMYKNIDCFYKHHSYNYPKVFRAALVYIKELLNNEDLYGAFYTNRRALHYHPRNHQLLLYMCNIVADMGHYKDASDYYDIMLKTVPNNYVMNEENLNKAIETSYEKISKGLKAQGYTVSHDSFKKPIVDSVD